jgi:hypothetical protein
MKKYKIRINTIIFDVQASNRITGIRRALNGYYKDETASESARKNRSRDEIDKTINISVKRIE